MAEAKRKKREKKAEQKNKQATLAIDSDNLPGGTLQMVPKRPAAIAIPSSPEPAPKKHKGPSPPVRLVKRQKQLILSLEDSASPPQTKTWP